MRIACTFLVIFLVCKIEKQAGEWKKFEIDGQAQGTSYHIAYYSTDSFVSKRSVDSLLDKIDSSLSLYKSYSTINRFNQSSKGIKTDLYLRQVVARGIEIYHDTRGLFDITVGPLTSAWGFGPAGLGKIPDSISIRKLLPCVSSQLLFFRKKELCKKMNCVQIDLNGIAQGYSVDLLAGLLELRGINNFIVELGGEIRVKGRKQPDGTKMSIGIEAPGEDPEFSLIERVIWPGEGAITTSGSYRRYYENNGRRITHILDPRSGSPVQNNLLSVTVFAKDAMTADGYDNALMVMGLPEALEFVETRKDLAAHFIYVDKQGKVSDTMSTRFRVLLKP